MMEASAVTLTRQSYGIACAQGRFGGAKGIWLECRSCDESQVIVGSRYDISMSDADAASVFRRHGWTGESEKMLNAHCPTCSGFSKP